MNTFRKKPVVVEAMEWTGQNATEVMEWMRSGGLRPWLKQKVTPDGNEALWFIVVPTLEGDMDAMEGDWIIKGVKGEFYPCKPDIFAATYEPVLKGSPHD